MWSYLLCVISLVVISISHWIYRWRNPKCKGKLPPGSMGLPLIGETLDFLATSKSLDIPLFIRKRTARYGPMFKTSLAGRSVVMVSDPNFIHYLLQQEGKLVERLYMVSFGKLSHKDKFTSTYLAKSLHKYSRSLVLSHFGFDRLKTDLLSKLENAIIEALRDWSKIPVVDIRSATLTMSFDFTSKMFFGYEAEESGENLAENLSDFLQNMMKFPLNIPGTAYHKSLKAQKKMMKLITETLEERRRAPEKHKDKEDLLNHVLKDVEKESFLTDDSLITSMIFWLLLASFETVSSTLTLAIKFITDHPSVLQKLMEEHETILKNRGNSDSGLSWEEYKSMTYTNHVVKETIRMGNVAPGMMRTALQDIEVDGYTIPKGWAILIVAAAIQLNPNYFEDPLTFNPSRWEKMGEILQAKNFIAFGGGSTSCAGADFTKLLLAVAIHHLVTKYKWTKIKEGELVRSTLLGFGDGFHIQLSEKLG